MKDSIYQIIKKYWQQDKYYNDSIELTNELCEELLLEADTVYEGDADEHRWIAYFTKVVQLGEHYIQFTDAMVTGDGSKWDQGWEMDWAGVIEVEPYETTITKYRRVSDG